jgi:hypothetical protein
MRPPSGASALYILSLMAFSVAMSSSPRPTPDWLEHTTTRYPEWVSRAIASRLPGIGFHSSGDLMNWSLS